MSIPRPPRATATATATDCRPNPRWSPRSRRWLTGPSSVQRPEGASLISVLQDINRDLGYLPEPALRYVSRKTNVPLLAVYHVATFYKAFSLTPRGKHASACAWARPATCAAPRSCWRR